MNLSSEQKYLPFTRPSLDEETISAVVEVLRSGWLSTGPQVKNFEESLAEYLNTNNTHRTSSVSRVVKSFTSATEALEVALRVCGIGPGDEVITPSFSFVATSNVILKIGATPVFVDVDLGTRNLKLEDIPKVITQKTKAIMPVHFAGRSVDLQELYYYANKFNLRVIEDAAHAIGSSWQGEKIGSRGDIVVFSFHPNKNITTIEGGAISIDANRSTEIKEIELHRFHGIIKDADNNTDVLIAGGKSNLSDVAACVGVGQLKQLDRFNQRRKELVELYYKLLSVTEKQRSLLQLPLYPQDQLNREGHSWHMFTPLLNLKKLKITRQEFISSMHKLGIGVGIHYPAIHLFELYGKLGYKRGDFPNTEEIGATTITLPLFPAMEDSDVHRVCAAINTLFSTH
ncbi:MAG: DegT/DnrJ/EryC1/StrS aminotransferase family protein [Oligoflexia bacterium]|nr:DegT/DnrJ/EryC1/StrS aminotransferase family protein [Oligoflexia bacterium]